MLILYILFLFYLIFLLKLSKNYTMIETNKKCIFREEEPVWINVLSQSIVCMEVMDGYRHMGLAYAGDDDNNDEERQVTF